MTPTTTVTPITRNMSATRRPRTEYVEGLKVYAKNQEDKLKAGELINKERLDSAIKDMKDILKRLEHVSKNVPAKQIQVLEDQDAKAMLDLIQKLDPDTRKALKDLLK